MLKLVSQRALSLSRQKRARELTSLMSDVELPFVASSETRECVDDLVQHAHDLRLRGHRADGTEDVVGDLGRK